MKKTQASINNWKITVEYEGTRYSGWQEQKHARTIAGEIRKAAEGFFSRPVEIIGAGRTDAGVHAIGQVARIRTTARARTQDIFRALNDSLPPDINVLKVEQARERFDPRRDAIARYYIYQISTRRSAFAKKFVWWVKDSLDFRSMYEASLLLAGRHDFTNFSEKSEDDRSTIVQVNHVEMARSGDLILFRIGASHFLWKMVRRLAGALVEVGRGKLSVKEFSRLLDASPSSPDSSIHVASHTAPPSGLFLERVMYSENETARPLRPAFPVEPY